MHEQPSSSHFQQIHDSEHDYLNTAFWDVHPLFLLVRQGDVEGFERSFDIRIESFPAERRVSASLHKQYEYLAVSLVNTFMVAAILGGAYPPEANWVADRALQRISSMEDLEIIPTIAHDAAVELCELVQQTKLKDTGNLYVEQAKRHLVTHLTQELHAVDVAQAVGLSPSYLSRLFKKHTGQTMRAFLTDERIKTAQHLLTTDDHSIAQIASLLRFCDQSHFTKVFREHTGLTPRQYRDANRR